MKNILHVVILITICDMDISSGGVIVVVVTRDSFEGKFGGGLFGDNCTTDGDCWTTSYCKKDISANECNASWWFITVIVAVGIAITACGISCCAVCTDRRLFRTRQYDSLS